MLTKADCKTPKDEEQFNVLSLWKANEFKGIYIGATGVGKTKIGVIAGCEFIKRNRNEKTIIITPTKPLRDNEWLNEIKKWGYEDCLDNITIECIQTAYKRKDWNFDTIIIDEVHTTLSKTYRKMYDFLDNKRILGLSATITNKEHLEFITAKLNIIKELHLKEALERGIVCAFNIYNIGIDLTEEEDIKYKEITEYIAKNYFYFDNDFALLINCMKTKSLTDLCYRKGLNKDYIRPIVYQLLKSFNTRTRLLHDSANKTLITKKIIELFENKKIMVFSESIVSVGNIRKGLKIRNRFIYHSNLHKDKRKVEIEKFRKCKAGVLLSVKALNVGLNVPECDMEIIHSNTSSKLDFTQRVGRVLRLGNNKISSIIQIYVRHTQEESWLKKRTKDIPNILYLKDYLELKELVQ